MQPKNLKLPALRRANGRLEFIHIALHLKHRLWACWILRASCSMIFWFFCCCPAGQQASVWSSGFLGRQWAKAARCVLFICLLRSGTHAGLFISPQQVCACADQLTCCCLFRVLFSHPVSWNTVVFGRIRVLSAGTLKSHGLAKVFTLYNIQNRYWLK